MGKFCNEPLWKNTAVGVSDQGRNKLSCTITEKKKLERPREFKA